MTAGKVTQLHLGQLFTGFLRNRAMGPQVDMPVEEVLPHQAAGLLAVDPRSALLEAVEVAEYLLEAKGAARMQLASMKAPAGWGSLIRSHEDMLAVPMCLALGLQTAAADPIEGFAVELGAPLPVDPDNPYRPRSLMQIPYRIAGLEGGAFRVDAIQETFVAPSGKEWKARLLLPDVQRIELTNGGLAIIEFLRFGVLDAELLKARKLIRRH